jgi:hypothetical protein
MTRTLCSSKVWIRLRRMSQESINKRTSLTCPLTKSIHWRATHNLPCWMTQPGGPGVQIVVRYLSARFNHYPHFESPPRRKSLDGGQGNTRILRTSLNV